MKTTNRFTTGESTPRTRDARRRGNSTPEWNAGFIRQREKTWAVPPDKSGVPILPFVSRPEHGQCTHRHCRGFTMVELLVAVAIVAILAVAFYPRPHGNRMRAAAIHCMHNTKQLTLGWIMYASDHGDNLMSNPGWCGNGIMDWTSNPANTDTASLLNSPMGAYVKSVAVFKCPADVYVSSANRGPRVRSYSMNAALGTTNHATVPMSSGTNDSGRSYITAKQASNLAVPGPANVFVILDEHPDSINDGTFVFDAGLARSAEVWRDLPAANHIGACGLSFADGHSEIHRWIERSGVNKTLYPVTMHTPPYKPWTAVTMNGSRDFEWLSDRMPCAGEVARPAGLEPATF